MADTPGNMGTRRLPDRVSDLGYRRRVGVAVLQCGLRAEVEIVGDELGGGDVLWSDSVLLVTASAGWHRRKV